MQKIDSLGLPSQRANRNMYANNDTPVSSNNTTPGHIMKKYEI